MSPLVYIRIFTFLEVLPKYPLKLHYSWGQHWLMRSKGHIHGPGKIRIQMNFLPYWMKYSLYLLSTLGPWFFNYFIFTFLNFQSILVYNILPSEGEKKEGIYLNALNSWCTEDFLCEMFLFLHLFLVSLRMKAQVYVYQAHCRVTSTFCYDVTESVESRAQEPNIVFHNTNLLE